ncbi:hypothetical protein J5J01_13165 [Streptomyces fradiae]|uniref:Uncharacterized protein n=1 Tax=Streptomyces rubrolavendulae TaxID=285473 RepID=A0A1D8G0V2_9ACTN|nr:hypothetical protein A4G23_01852 [Streptomyces rubrolavendulae]UQS32397.1 hypothetical protein J5J01_13165 [Streptomyces fradiae]
MKGLAELDEHQVRRYPSRARRVTLAMPAHAVLAVVRADEHAHRSTPGDLIPLSCKEICRQFIRPAVRPVRNAAHGLPGPTGTPAIRPDHAPATTDGKPHTRHEDHDLQV